MQLKINFKNNSIEECTLDGFFEWLKYSEQMSPSSIKRYTSTIKRALTFTTFTCEIEVRKFLIDYVREHKADDGRYTKFIFIKYLKYLKMDYSVLENIKVKRSARKRHDVLEEWEFQNILNSDIIDRWPKLRKRNNVLLTLLWTTGLRISEATDIRYENLLDDQLFIRNGKGMKEAHVFCHHIVKQYILETIDDRLPEDFVFRGKTGRRLNTSSVNEFIKKRVAYAHINKKISAHSFRRSFATNLIDKNISIPIVQELMRHDDPSTTAGYIYISKSKIQNIWSKVFTSNFQLELQDIKGRPGAQHVKCCSSKDGTPQNER